MLGIWSFMKCESHFYYWNYLWTYQFFIQFFYANLLIIFRWMFTKLFAILFLFSFVIWKNYFSCVNGKTLLLSSGEFYYSSSEWFDYFFSIWGSYFGSLWIFSSLDVIDGIKSLKVLFFWTFYNKINWCYLLKKSL